MGCVSSIEERQRLRHQRLRGSRNEENDVFIQPIIDDDGNVVGTQTVSAASGAQPGVIRERDAGRRQSGSIDLGNGSEMPNAHTNINNTAMGPGFLTLADPSAFSGPGVSSQNQRNSQRNSQNQPQFQGQPVIIQQQGLMGVSPNSNSTNFTGAIPVAPVGSNMSMGGGMPMQTMGGMPMAGIPMSSNVQPVQMQQVQMSYNGNFQFFQPQICNKTPPNLTGRQRALLIGCNYFGTRAALKGCINDCKNVFSLLVQTFNWSPNSIRLLTDDGQGFAHPTRMNILQSLHWLAGSGACQPGDVMFLLFSGHGAQKEDPHGFEEDGMNETILPVDFQKAGMITDDELADICVRPLPEGARLTCLMDSCHSGTGLDLPYTWMGGRGWKEDVNPFHSAADVQMFSGCEDGQTSSDGGCVHGQRAGAMTTAFCEVTRQFYGTLGTGLTYDELLAELHRNMIRNRFSQRPMLTSTQAFDLDRIFILDGIVMNTNMVMGRIFRHKFPPQPRPMGGPLGDMLGMAAGVMGGMMMADLLFGF